jgi:hypothetical protein
MKNHKLANLTIYEQQADRSRPIRMGRWDRDSDSNWGRRVSDDPPGRRHPASGGPLGVSATMAVGTDRRCVPGDPHSRRSVRHTKHGESPVRTGRGRPVHQHVSPDVGSDNHRRYRDSRHRAEPPDPVHEAVVRRAFSGS